MDIMKFMKNFIKYYMEKIKNFICYIEVLYDEMLFANVAVEKKRTLTKKDTVITLHTLSIGIGNKPYIRGNAEPLNKDKGIAMDYVEIGVWRVVLPSFDGEINYSIWKNDEEQIGEELYQITSDQKQEITI